MFLKLDLRSFTIVEGNKVAWLKCTYKCWPEYVFLCVGLFVFSLWFLFLGLQIVKTSVVHPESWLGKKSNPMILPGTHIPRYWRLGCKQDKQILPRRLLCSASYIVLFFINKYILKVCLLHTLHSIMSNSYSWLHIQVMLCNLLMFFALSSFTRLTQVSFKFQLRYFLLQETCQNLIPCHAYFYYVPEIVRWRHLSVMSDSISSLRINIISYSSLHLSAQLHAWLVLWAQ